MNVITQDPAFGPNALAVRAWGQYGTTPLAAPGLEARIEQWFLGMPIPAMTQGHTSFWGRAELAAVPTGTRGSGFCLELSTASAMVTDFVLPSTLCDFRVWDPANAPPGGRSLEDFKLGHISTAKGVQMLIDDPRLMGLTQADDVYQWAKAVAKFSVPRRAKILSGFYADTFARNNGATPPKKTMFAPCLGYGNSFSDTALGVALLGTSAVGAALLGPIGVGLGSVATAVFTSTIMSTDIVMPLNSALPTSREVMSHEYGHYLFCSLLQVPNPQAVSYLAWSTTTSSSLELTFPVRYLNEAMADFFTGQVVGGHDYRWLNNVDGSGRYCVPPVTPPALVPHCWDQNHRSFATALDGRQSIARASSLIHDVFDGQVNTNRFAHRPNDGDLWAPLGSGSTALGFNTIGYNNTDVALDRVALSGEALIEIAWHLAVGLYPDGNASQHLNDQKLHEALNTVMEDHGVNWCDRCQVLALHSNLLSSETIPALLQTCTVDPLLAGMGPPPVPLGRLEASTCEACLPGQAADANGVCGDNCPADVVIDASTLTVSQQTFATTSSPAGDTCPDVFVLRIENMAALPADLVSVDTLVSISPDTPEVCERPYEMRQEIWDSGATQTVLQSVIGVSPDCSGGGICVPYCASLPFFSVGRASADEVEYRTAVDPHTSVTVAPVEVLP